MNRVTFIALLSLFSITSKSQIARGNWLVGGNANLSSSKQNLINSTDKNSSIMFSILPTIGYFIVDKFAFGINPGASFTQSKNNNTKSNVTSYRIGPFAKYYFLETDNMANLFLQGSFGYGINRFNNFGNTATNKYVSYLISGGPVIYFNTSVGLEFSLGWKYDKAIEDKSTTNSLVVGIGFQIHLEK